MTTIYREVESILTSQATTLEALAGIVGLSVEELFAGESFAGIDLRDEPLAVLLRMDADFEGAILSREQTRALREGRGVRAERVRRARLDIVRSARRDRLEDYVVTYFPKPRQDAARAVLVAPLLVDRERPLRWEAGDLSYAVDALRFILAEGDSLRRNSREAVLRFLIHLMIMRFPLDVGVIETLWGGAVMLDPATMRQVVDLDLCTERFVFGWLDRIGASSSTRTSATEQGQANRLAVKSGHPASDVFGDALSYAIQAPTKAPISYYERILSRARSLDEMLGLVRLVPSRLVDPPFAALFSRVLAQAATSAAAISEIALDERLHPRVRAAFRSLVVAAGTVEGREALLDIITDTGERASGLEVDAILAGLAFQESLDLMRRRWDQLASHHRHVALDAIAAKASSPRERDAVKRLREQHGRDH